MDKPNEAINPFKNYVFCLEKEGKKINPVLEIVNMYYVMIRKNKEPKEFYTGRYNYSKLAREAKTLLLRCDNKLDDALWCLDKMKYKAERGNFDWSIITCTKHNLQ